MTNPSFWQQQHVPQDSFPTLDRDIETDVAIIGAGITGVTAAARLKEAGVKTVVLEKGTAGGLVSSHSSAHLSNMLDTWFHKIEDNFSTDEAALAAQAVSGAIDHIESNVAQYGLNCGFRRVHGYLYTEEAAKVPLVRKEMEAAQRAGLQVEHISEAGLPFRTEGIIRFAGQGQIDPLQYVRGLAARLHSPGCSFYENTMVDWVEEGDPHIITTASGYTIKAKKVFMATHMPLSINPVQAEIYPNISYCIALKCEAAETMEGLYMDTATPYHYIRNAESGTYGKVLIIGGADHRTGQVQDTERHYAMLEAYAKERFGSIEVVARWSAQYYQPADGLPFIGQSALRKNLWIATGYAGDGLTWGTAAGLIVADQILGKYNKYSKLLSATRLNLKAAAPDMIKENFQSIKQLFLDRFTDAEIRDLKILQPGEGGIVQLKGKKLAVYRQENGAYYAMSPECHHMGCYVRWNKAEKTWDCPCHGSRYEAMGKVLYPPVLHGMEGKFLDL